MTREEFKALTTFDRHMVLRGLATELLKEMDRLGATFDEKMCAAIGLEQAILQVREDQRKRRRR